MTVKEQSPVNMNEVCRVLDKLALKQLHLMEEKMQCEMRIECNVNGGSINLAKARYIMGHTAVSATKLPNEGSSEFAASTYCQTVENEANTTLKLLDNTIDTVNPIHWFGVLVPQNLHKAAKLFRDAVGYVIDCANVQLQINKVAESINLLRKYKSIV